MRQQNVEPLARKSSPRALLAVSLVMLLTTSNAWSDGTIERRYTAAVQVAAAMGGVEVGTDYAWGINRFEIDPHTEIVGWRISDAWYFGRQDGLDSGLTLVWQQSANQVSLSKDGVRLTRRF